ncbi:MAG: M20/M25/M40 family metallo-hydrolase, partial [Gemmatimonadaceae bacterium]
RGIAVANSLATYASEEPAVDDVGNVIALFSHALVHRNQAPIVCLAHLDTVFERDTVLNAHYENTRVYCPGIGDNSRGLAAMITLARVLHGDRHTASRLRRPIEFVATVGEEGLGNLRGAQAYFANRTAHNKPIPHAVLVLDGPGDENIVHHALGSRRYRITFRGAGGHSWVDFGAPNAVHAAARAAAMLADVPRHMHARVALTVSGIGGGESMNSIPANAWLDVDVRATEHATLTRVDVELRNIVREAAQSELSSDASRNFPRTFHNTTPLNTNIELLGERPCGSLAVEHSLVQLAQAASLRHGVEPVSAVASTDANIPLSLGIPAITIGAGGTGGGAHTLHEWYDNTHGSRGVARAFAILAALAA